MRQIFDVIQFEVKKNLKKFLILLVIEVLFAVLSIILPIILSIFLPSLPLPDEMSAYLSGIIGNITLLAIIMSCAYGGSIIAQEFDKKTGCMLFPKISRNKLFIGKWISQYVLLIGNILIYYLFVLLAAVINYPGHIIPVEFYQSFLLAVLYTAMLFSFIMMFSSFMKNSALTIIIAFLLLFMGFSMVTGIFMLISVETEPLFDLTYFGNVITQIFNFPDERFMEFVIPIPGEVTFTIRTWITPAINIFIIFMIIYIIMFNIIGYFAFKRREL